MPTTQAMRLAENARAETGVSLRVPVEEPHRAEVRDACSCLQRCGTHRPRALLRARARRDRAAADSGRECGISAGRCSGRHLREHRQRPAGHLQADVVSARGQGLRDEGVPEFRRPHRVGQTNSSSWTARKRSASPTPPSCPCGGNHCRTISPTTGSWCGSPTTRESPMVWPSAMVPAWAPEDARARFTRPCGERRNS